MATVSSDPRYQAIAAAASQALGGGSNVARAIAAHWQCEQRSGDPWPPEGNNPGNVHSEALASVGIASSAGRYEGGGHLAVFPTAQAGAIAYAELLNRASRYAGARAAAHNDDGQGFLRAVTSAGYGTSYSCAAGVFGSSADMQPAAATVAGSAGPVASTACNGGAPAGTVAGVVGRDEQLTLTNLPAIASAIATATSLVPGWPGGAEKVSDVRAWLVDFVGHCLSTIPVNVTDPSKTFQATTRAPDLVGGIFQGLGVLVSNGLILVLIVYLAIRGFRGLAESGGGS